MKKLWLAGVAALHLGLILACTGSSSEKDDTADTAPPDTAPPDDTDDTGDTHPSGEFTLLSDPCSGAGTPYAMRFTSASEGWYGCGNGIGLYHTTDGGDSFEAGHPSADLYVFDIEQAADGDMLVCGHDYGADNGVLLYRGTVGDWAPLLRYGNNADGTDMVYMSNCGQVAEAGDGTMIVASNTAGDLTWSTDDGLNWAKEERYWENANLEGGYSYYYMLQLQAAGGVYYGAGSKIDEPPVFFTPSALADAEFYNFEAHIITSSVEGETWALATSDGGLTWFAGGRDQSASAVASGFLYRSDDGGETWTSIVLGDEIDILRAIAFDATGTWGVAVGHRYPTMQGGFVLLTEDGGATWTELDEETDLLYSAAVYGSTYWVAGDAFLARGTF